MDLTPILRCPRCRGALAAPSPDRLVCAACAVRFPVADGIPNLLPDAAEPLAPPDHERPAR